MAVEVLGGIRHIVTIATGRRIRELSRLERAYGRGRWRKRKGEAHVRIGGETLLAEVHWYEAAGVGRKELKIKRILSG